MVLPEEHAMPMREKKGLKMDLREMIALSILDPPSFRVFCSPNRRGYDNAEQEKGKQQSHAENDNKKRNSGCHCFYGKRQINWCLRSLKPLSGIASSMAF
ncbi:hypothetical protein V6N12_021525 [Hibiscus sabdariffa]|uniref:Uncharacterized protein n=1 Tax=Hibiscus sabdariffa TaxID=183260 RepID=A0ABR2FSF0_9ROSI